LKVADVFQACFGNIIHRRKLLEFQAGVNNFIGQLQSLQASGKVSQKLEQCLDWCFRGIKIGNSEKPTCN